MDLRLRCDWGNPFSCGLFADDGPARRALAGALVGLTVSHYSWSVTDQQFQVRAPSNCRVNLTITAACHFGPAPVHRWLALKLDPTFATVSV